jgi:hypothetical protein
MLTQEYKVPERWAIRRSDDSTLLNKYFSKEYNKTYTADGIYNGTDPISYDYFHYPMVRGVRAIENYVSPGYELITLEIFKKYILKEEEKEEIMDEKIVIPQTLLNEVKYILTDTHKKLIIENVDFITRETTKKFIKNFYDQKIEKNCIWKKRLEEYFSFLKEDQIDLKSGKLLKMELFSDNSYSAAIQIRDGGKYKNKAFFLSDQVEWELKRDYENHLCLIPKVKK